MLQPDTPAESLLRSLGVAEPEDIDVAAIAWAVGARVKERALAGCEARIIGRGDRAIISIDSRSHPARKRFSVAHELGHWHHHKGRCLSCGPVEVRGSKRGNSEPEWVADNYASDLLLPRYLLEPILASMPTLTIDGARQVAIKFDVSLMAALNKMVAIGPFPIMLVCHSTERRLWYRRSPALAVRLFPKGALDSRSNAARLLDGPSKNRSLISKVAIDNWFDAKAGGDNFVVEETFRLPGNQVCSILTFPI